MIKIYFKTKNKTQLQKIICNDIEDREKAAYLPN